MSARIFFYVQHLLGIGHLRRAALIARALVRQDIAVSFISGGAPVADLDLGGGGLVQLPPAFSADAQFSAILDERGRPIDDAWRARRRQILLDEFAAGKFDLLLIEMFPFGRRQFAFELQPLLAAAKARAIPVAVSLRDILVAKNKPARVAETLALVNEYVDVVLVHGDPTLVGLEATFPAAGEIAPPIVYTGYVAETPRPAAGPIAEGDEILVSVGGGGVGGPLLRAALAARPATRAADAPWRLIAGPNLPQSEFAALGATLPPGVSLERFRNDFPQLMARSRLSISQAGYNTVMDILSGGVRALVLPFAEGGESEQTLRARLMAARGLLGLVEPPFEPKPLAAAIDAALMRARPLAGQIDLDGANSSARYLRMRLGLAARPAGAPRP
jgi:predicted glycosyltransferase